MMFRRREKAPVGRSVEEILDDMRENLRKLEELALFNHPDLTWTPEEWKP